MNAFTMNALFTKCTFELPPHFGGWGKPSRSALNQKVSLVKAVKPQHAEHLQVLIRGVDSKDRFIRMELPFLPSLNTSAVWCMFGPVASPEMENWNFPEKKSLAKAAFS